MKQSYFTSPGFTFRLQPFGTPTALFLLFFLLNFSFGYGQDCTINSSALDPTDESPIPLNLNFEGPVNRDLTEDDFIVSNGEIGNFERGVPEFVKGAEDIALTEFEVTVSYIEFIALDLDEIGAFIEPQLSETVISISELNDSHILFLTYGDGVKEINKNGTITNPQFISFSNFNTPLDIEATDYLQNPDPQVVYIADKEDLKIKRFNNAGVNLTNWGAGVLGDGENEFYGPTGLASDDNYIYLADAYTGGADGLDLVKIYDHQGNLEYVLSEETGYDFYDPYRIAVDGQGRIYVADGESNADEDLGRIQVFEKNILNNRYELIHTIKGEEEDKLGAPGSMVIDEYGYLYVIDYEDDLTLSSIYSSPLDIILNFTKIKNTQYSINIYNTNSNFDYVSEFNQDLNLPIDLELSRCGDILVNNLELSGPGLDFSADFFGNVLDINFNFQLKTFTRHDNFTAEVTPEEEGEVVVTLNSDNDFFPCDPQPECSFSINYETEAAPNESPVAVADNYSVQENETLVVNAADGVLENDSDPEDDALTAVLVDDVQNGTLDFESDGSFTYTPNPGFTDDDDTFTYYATDGEDNSNEVTVVIRVTSAPNEAPVAVPDNYSIQEDETLVSDAADGVLENDSDPEDDALTAVLVDDVQNGTLDFESDGSFTYTPNPGFTDDDDTFTYYATDGEDNSNEVTVVIRVTSAPNEAPVAVPDNYYIQEDETLVIDAANGVLENDSDPEDDALTAVLVDNVENGTLDFESDGSFSYTPSSGYTGQETFTYQANDGKLDSYIVTVTITVTSGPNGAPVAVPDNYSIQQNETLVVNAADGVLENDSDPEDDALTAVLVDDVENGTLDFESDGSFSYIPNSGYTGQETFTYQVNDGNLDSNIVTVTITVTSAPNGVPVAVPDNYSIQQNETLVVNAADGVLENDSDPEDDALTAVLVDDVQNGTLDFESDGSFTYTPNPGFTDDDDTFTYYATDGEDNSNEVTVVIRVTSAPNEAPVAVPDNYYIQEDETLVIDAADGVLENDSDPEDDALTAVLVDNVENGTLDFESDGSFSYIPNSGYTGQETFTYQVNDGNLDSNIVTVTITVTSAPNEAPVAVPDNYYIQEDETLVIDAANGVLENDSDPEDDALTAVLVDNVENGTLDFESDGSFSYTPSSGYTGQDTFTYQANDGNLDSNIVTVTITVNTTTAPTTFQCKENIEVFLDENGEANLNIQELYTGDASGLNLEASRLNFTCEDLGAAFIQLDYSGDETGSCTINVDVRDELPPQINTNLVELTLDIEGFAYLEESDISAEDNCSEELIYRFSKSVFTCKDVGMNSVNVEVEDINGNRSDKNIQVRVSGEGCDLPEPGENEYLFIYPNPNNGIFTIATPEGMFIEQVRVFDSRGRYIMQQDYNANARFYRMTIQGVEESVYTLQIFTNEGVIVKRAIIKR